MEKGTRVELHPATDDWMRGDRYGTVTGFGRARKYYDKIAGQEMTFKPVKVRLDKSGRVKSFHPANVIDLGEQEKAEARAARSSDLLANPRDRFSASELAELRTQYAGIKTVNPDRLEDFRRIFAGMSDAAIKQLAGADVKFVSKLALNEVTRRGLRQSNPKGMAVGAVKLTWPHTFAGGTSAAPGKYGYESERLPIGYFSISPISWPNGRHRGYVARFVNDKGAVPGGLHQTIGTFSSPAKAKVAALDTYKGILIAQAKQGAPAYRGKNPVKKSKARKNPARDENVDYIIVAVSPDGEILAFWKGMEWGNRRDWAASWHSSALARSAAQDILRMPPGHRGAKLAVIPEDMTAAKLKAAVAGKA